MKKYYLSYNSLTGYYCLDKGVFSKNRESFGFNNLERNLKEHVPGHKEIMLYISNNLDDLVKDKLKEIFDKTRVKLKSVKDLRQV